MTPEAAKLYQEAVHYAVTCARHLSPPPPPAETEWHFKTNTDIFREQKAAHFLFPDLNAAEIATIIDLRWRCILLTMSLNASTPDPNLDKDEITFTERRGRFVQSETWKNLRPLQQEILHRVYLNPNWTHPDLRVKKSWLKKTLQKILK